VLATTVTAKNQIFLLCVFRTEKNTIERECYSLFWMREQGKKALSTQPLFLPEGKQGYHDTTQHTTSKDQWV
jgi:hypothetical protein